MRTKTETLLKKEGLSFSPETKLRDMSISSIQMLEIIKAISFNAEILIMDEPTSSISNKEVEELLKKLEDLKARGMSIIYISHKMDEIFRIADEITVLRDGKTIKTLKKAETNINEIIELMVGRKLEKQYPKEDMIIGEPVMEVHGLTKENVFYDINFQVHRGEIIGFAGLVGAGRTEVMRAVFGLDSYDKGSITVKGKPLLTKNNVGKAVKSGISMVTEDRKLYGIVPIRSVTENATLANLKKYFAGGRHNRVVEKKDVLHVFDKVRVKTPSLDTPIQNLSGGNQQKVILAKWMLCDESDVIIMDEPTRGIDVGAKKEIYDLMIMLAKSGKGIVMISSELPELIGMCDRIYIMKEGKMTGCIDRKEEFTQEGIMSLAIS